MMTAAGSPETSAHIYHIILRNVPQVSNRHCLQRCSKYRHYVTRLFDVSSVTTVFKQRKAKDGCSYRQALTACASRCQNLRSVIFARFFTLFLPLLAFSVTCFQPHAVYIVLPYFYTSCSVLRFFMNRISFNGVRQVLCPVEFLMFSYLSLVYMLSC
jgi:hypothetical protein